jgi:hypothetical protein
MKNEDALVLHEQSEGGAAQGGGEEDRKEEGGRGRILNLCVCVCVFERVVV